MEYTKMEFKKAQKRPYDHDAAWNGNGSSSCDYTVEKKRPHLLDTGSGDSQKLEDGTLSSSQKTVQHQNASLAENGDTLQFARVVKETNVREQETNDISLDSQKTVDLSDNEDEKTGKNRTRTKILTDISTSIVHTSGNSDLGKISSCTTITCSNGTFAAAAPIVWKGDVKQSEEPGSSSDTKPSDCDSSSSPQSLAHLWKNTSLAGDAATIASIIPDVESSVVFETLARYRAHPDRLNITTAAILDSASASTSGFNGLHEMKTVSAADRAGTTSVTASSDGEKHLSSPEVNTIAGNKAGTSTTANNGLYEDVKKVIVKFKTENPNAELNPTEVYMLLEQHKGLPNRLDFVYDLLVKKNDTHDQHDLTGGGDDIFELVVELTSQFPDVNPSEIYEFLESLGDQENRVQLLKEHFQAQRTKTNSLIQVSPTSTSDTTPGPTVQREDSISKNPLVQNDPVFHDMRTIAKMFPEKDQNVLYAMVEAHYYKKDRVQVVVEELLREEKNSQEVSQESSAEGERLGHVIGQMTGDVRGQAEEKIHSSSDFPEDYAIQAEVDFLKEVFPDCYPDYIYMCLEEHRNTPNRVKVIASRFFEKRDYPRLKDVLEKQKMAAKKRHFQGTQFTMEEFLAKFPDPVTAFVENKKEMTENYRKHLHAQVVHDYPEFKFKYIQSVLEKHTHHLLPVVKELHKTRTDIAIRGVHSKMLRGVPKVAPLEYPEEPEEYFFYELWYFRNEDRVTEYLEERVALRQVKIAEAKENNQLYECPCCFEDECLFEDMNICADGHLFCKQCIARSAEAAFGEGKTIFPCLTGFCEHQIPLSVLKEVLPSSMFSKILRKLQEEEVRQAGIPDLVDCPFCSFATIISDPNDHIFHCLNPDCLIDSCRLCREPNHVPLNCEEVEKGNETKMRTFIERRVTEAMLRKCHRCGKSFMKDSGCNKMTCVCGATSCYICREPDISYEHFTNNQRCNYADETQVHHREMLEAAKEAREEYVRKHPEAANINLKYDPQQHISDIPVNPYHTYEDDYSDDSFEGHSESYETFSSESDDDEILAMAFADF